MATEVAARKPRRARPKPRPITDDEEEPLAPDSGKTQTRAKFNEVLQQAYLESTQNDGKKKKKKVRTDRSTLLESLKKGEGIRKETNDSMLLANTYDPDDDPKSNKKSNKQRQRQMQKQVNGIENQAYKEENETLPRKPRNKPRKTIESDTDKPMTIADLAPPIKKKDRDREPPDTPVTVKKKKKKKRPETDEESQEQVLSEGAETAGEEIDQPPEEKHVTSDLEDSQPKTTKKRRKKKKETVEDEPEEERPPDIEDHGRIVCLTVHRTDKLKTDFLISHPLVRVTVVDESTGNYLKKQHNDRAVTSYYENDSVEVVLPIMTQPFDFKQNKSTLPVWEEPLIFNENFDYFIQETPPVILFFEILDFMSMHAAGRQANTPSQEGGWHRIAWGFLKSRGGNGQPNTDKKVRLQLYQPPVRFRAKSDQLEIFQWSRALKTMIPYPSTLYVTLKGIIPPDVIEPAPRSMFANQEEKGRYTYDEMQRTMDGGTMKRENRGRGPSLWTRLTGQLCKVPNNLYLGLPAGKKGCFVVRFSYDGKYLACGCHDKDGYPILIYDIPTGRFKGQLNGHYSIIYDMSWSKSHKQLLTASADGTARVWDIEKMSNTAVKTAPHPSFVYTAKFHVRVDKVIVTGGYDRMIRIWTTKGDDTHALLVQELDGHTSYVNSICFDLEGQTMYSADSMGQIFVWSVYATDKPSSNGVLKEWTLSKEISDSEIKGVAINSLTMHPSGRRLLVHTRDNILRLYDLRIGAIMQRYRGALNFREHIRSTLSSCGSFVFTGSEDSCAYVWNSDTGDQVASYKELGYRHPVCDVDFHPHDHMVAFCSYGENHQVLVYKYDHRVAQRDVGLDPSDPARVTPKTGRPQSPDIKPGTEFKADDEALDTLRMSKTETMDVNLQHSARMDRARRKLDSVMTFQGSILRPGSPPHPLGIQRDTSPVPMGTAYGTTWGSTFDSTGMYTQGKQSAFSSYKSPYPSAFSPHASKNVTSALVNQQQLAAQTDYMKQGHGGWRPGFTDVGGKPITATRVPVTISTAQGKPILQIHGNKKSKHWVVALYDYQKQRSDELAFSRGDVMRVVCKDTDNWWLAVGSTGEEGYIPANYFTTDGGENEELQEYQRAIDKADEDDDDNDDDLRRSRTTAVVSQSGELKFISGTEDSDAESVARRKTKNRRSRASSNNTLDVESDSNSNSTRVHRKRRPKVMESSA